LRNGDEGERVPFTIAGPNVQNGEIDVIFQIVGVTTRKLAALSVGDSITDLCGPLGKPSDIPTLGTGEKAVIIGGGVGTAVAYPTLKSFAANGIPTDVIAGFRTADLTILEPEMRPLADNLYITLGNELVTDKLRALLDSGANYRYILAIGPVPMMSAVSKIGKEYNIHTVVSLNPIMVDGTGMCGCCRVTVNGKIKFACIEGPEFDADGVDFAELTARNRTYN
ncbi:MAG: sulfide/dihydroorotate dehydrogenase-like FAD/NAD-binding protein, partial [Oscillospiraceae bacterium]|nr:sulfide/dihydroorotate dehydrogenase-like FAD/NAD-binding protein [Oscillospiraceae bacterium]